MLTTPAILQLLLLTSWLVDCQRYDKNINYWEAFAPGKLLQRLDMLTDSAAATNLKLPMQWLPKQPNATTPLAHRKVDAKTEYNNDDHGDGDADVDDAEAETELSSPSSAEQDANSVDSLSAEVSKEEEPDDGDDYERDYEQFVRQYFDRVENDDDDIESNDGDDIDEHDEVVAAPATHATQQRQQGEQHCKRVHRKGQLCKICREPHNNEVSETCTYSHEGAPQEYNYGSGMQYKRYKAHKSHDDEDGDDSEDAAEQAEQAKQATGKASASSLCVRRLHKQRVCYECKDSSGERLRRCYAAGKAKPKPGRRPRKRKTKNEQRQRIYKRTLSYAYTKASSSDDTNKAALQGHELPTIEPNNQVTTTALPLADPALAAGETPPRWRQRHRTVIKVVRTKRKRNSDGT